MKVLFTLIMALILVSPAIAQLSSQERELQEMLENVGLSMSEGGRVNFGENGLELNRGTFTLGSGEQASQVTLNNAQLLLEDTFSGSVLLGEVDRYATCLTSASGQVFRFNSQTKGARVIIEDGEIVAIMGGVDGNGILIPPTKLSTDFVFEGWFSEYSSDGSQQSILISPGSFIVVNGKIFVNEGNGHAELTISDNQIILDSSRTIVSMYENERNSVFREQQTVGAVSTEQQRRLVYTINGQVAFNTYLKLSMVYADTLIQDYTPVFDYRDDYEEIYFREDTRYILSQDREDILTCLGSAEPCVVTGNRISMYNADVVWTREESVINVNDDYILARDLDAEDLYQYEFVQFMNNQQRGIVMFRNDPTALKVVKGLISAPSVTYGDVSAFAVVCSLFNTANSIYDYFSEDGDLIDAVLPFNFRSLEAQKAIVTTMANAEGIEEEERRVMFASSDPLSKSKI